MVGVVVGAKSFDLKPSRIPTVGVSGPVVWAKLK